MRLGERKRDKQRKLDTVHRVDHIVWLGDLNYRIDLPRDEVVRLIRRGEWPTLRRSDQLAQAMGSGEAAAGFREGVIGFAPTFKHVPGVGPSLPRLTAASSSAPPPPPADPPAPAPPPAPLGSSDGATGQTPGPAPAPALVSPSTVPGVPAL